MKLAPTLHKRNGAHLLGATFLRTLQNMKYKSSLIISIFAVVPQKNYQKAWV